MWIGTYLQKYFRSSDLAGCAGYGRKVKYYRYLAGLSSLSHISAETSPSPGIAAPKKARRAIEKESSGQPSPIPTDCITPGTNLVLALHHTATPGPKVSLQQTNLQLFSFSNPPLSPADPQHGAQLQQHL